MGVVVALDTKQRNPLGTSHVRVRANSRESATDDIAVHTLPRMLVNSHTPTCYILVL